MRYQRCNANRGQVLVLIAIAILVILGALGLCTDVAAFYFNWAQLRKEVDAAALAGANYLPDNPTMATSTAATWVQTNGQPSDQILQNSTGTQGYNQQQYSSLTVKVQRTVPYYFGKVVRSDTLRKMGGESLSRAQPRLWISLLLTSWQCPLTE